MQTGQLAEQAGQNKVLFLSGPAAADAVEALRSAAGATTEFSKRGAMALAAEQWADVEPGGEIMVTGRAVGELLTGAVAAVHTGRPLFIYTPDRMPPVVRKELTRLAPSSIVLIGTLEAMPPAVRTKVGGLLAPR